jgi:hypothetical protein
MHILVENNPNYGSFTLVDTLSWEYQGITHTVMGNIPYDEIMKIAEGIR